MLCLCTCCRPSHDGVYQSIHRFLLRVFTSTYQCDLSLVPPCRQALMLAASADSAEGVGALVAGGASVELADALGRTALMFAAGRSAACALIALLRAGASVRASPCAEASSGHATCQHSFELSRASSVPWPRGRLPRACQYDITHALFTCLSCVHTAFTLALYAITTPGDVPKAWSCWSFTSRPPSS